MLRLGRTQSLRLWRVIYGRDRPKAREPPVRCLPPAPMTHSAGPILQIQLFYRVGLSAIQVETSITVISRLCSLFTKRSSFADHCGKSAYDSALLRYPQRPTFRVILPLMSFTVL